jgi:hypothetical protein
MLKNLDNIKSQKDHHISDNICNVIKSSLCMDNISGQRILAYRHGVRFYKFPRREKALPVCS